MIVKTLVIDIHLPASKSLKDKRSIIKSILLRSRQKFNVSASEVDDIDDHKNAVLGFAIITNSNAYADEILDKCLNLIESEYNVELINLVKERN